MADSVYISKNLNHHQLLFMKLLEDFEVSYFDMRNIENTLQHSFDNLNEVLENLVDKDLLVRIERGKFARSNYNNVFRLSTFICPNSCIGYWSALHFHGMTDRFSTTLFVKTTRRKRSTRVLGTSVQFVSVHSKKFLGKIWEGYGDDAFLITDKEMTIVDCFDQRRYAGDFSDLIAAIAHTQMDAQKLIQYTQAYDNIAVIKRLGFLIDFFRVEQLADYTEFAKTQVNQRYNLLDSSGMDRGEFLSEWKLRLNISKKELIQLSKEAY